MIDYIDLKKLEIKVWAAYFRDGLWDIFYGLMLLTMGIRTLTDNVWFTAGILGAILIFTLGKIFVTLPRLGYIKFGEKRRARLFLMIVLIGISVLITAIIGWIFSDNQGRFGGITATITFAGLFITVFGLQAFFMNHSRFILYGLLFFIVIFALNDPLAAILSTVFGSVLFIWGAILFILFIRQNPTPVNVKG